MSTTRRAAYTRPCTKVDRMVKVQASLLADDILPELREHNVCVVNYNELEVSDQEELGKWFKSNLEPILDPRAAGAYTRILLSST